MDTGAGQAMKAMYGSGMGGMATGGGASPSTMPAGSPMVDQIDGDVASIVMGDGSTKQVPLSSLPPGTKEGDILGGGGAPSAKGNMYGPRQQMDPVTKL
jgi:hypothetical protein